MERLLLQLKQQLKKQEMKDQKEEDLNIKKLVKLR